MSKLVFVSKEVADRETVLMGSFRSDVDVKVVDGMNTKDQWKAMVEGGKQYETMSFAYHFPGNVHVPFFDLGLELNNKYGKRTIGDEFIDFMKEMKAEHGVSTVDYLTCNMNQEEFKLDVAELETELGIDIRYSVDQTGNNPEGNWVLESDNVNVKDYYFTSGIDSWTGVLNSAISGANIANIDGISVSTVGTKTVYSLNQDITWNSSLSGLSAGTDYIQLTQNEIFEGNNYTITIDDSNNKGIFTTTTLGSANKWPHVANVTVESTSPLNSTYEIGYVVRFYTSGISIFGCSTSTEVVSLKGGGIIGGNANQSNKYLLIDSCKCTSDLTGRYTGGIAGYGTRLFTIQNCVYTDGSITNTDSAGICSFVSAGSSNIIQNCVTGGTIKNGSCAGICWASSVPVTIQNCISKCTIDATSNSCAHSSFIYGAGSSSASVTIQNCLVLPTVINNPYISGFISLLQVGNNYVKNCILLGDTGSNGHYLVGGGYAGNGYFSNCYFAGGAKTVAEVATQAQQLYFINLHVQDITGTYLMDFMRGPNPLVLRDVYADTGSTIAYNYNSNTEYRVSGGYQYVSHGTHAISDLQGSVGGLNASYSSFVDADQWSAVSGDYPILQAFTASPWNGSTYTAYDSYTSVDMSSISNYGNILQSDAWSLLASSSGSASANPICFLVGSLIKMSDGSSKDVKDVKRGDELMCQSGSTTVNRILRLNCDNVDSAQPYKVGSALLSGNHLVYVNGGLYRACDVGVKQASSDLRYYHFETSNGLQDLLNVGGVWCESWDGHRWGASDLEKGYVVLMNKVTKECKRVRLC